MAGRGSIPAKSHFGTLVFTTKSSKEVILAKYEYCWQHHYWTNGTSTVVAFLSLNCSSCVHYCWDISVLLWILFGFISMIDSFERCLIITSLERYWNKEQTWSSHYLQGFVLAFLEGFIDSSTSNLQTICSSCLTTNLNTTIRNCVRRWHRQALVLDTDVWHNICFEPVFLFFLLIFDTFSLFCFQTRWNQDIWWDCLSFKIAGQIPFYIYFPLLFLILQLSSLVIALVFFKLRCSRK
jgi:hypothetical protein